MIYLNNAAESYPKYGAVIECVKGLPYYDNGRNCNCKIKLSPAQKFRTKLFNFLHLPSNYQVTITNSATESANLILRSLDLNNIVKIDRYSHNCIVRTCNDLNFKKCFVESLDNNDEPYNILCLTHQSNIDGSVINLREYYSKIKSSVKENLIIILDISQSIGNIEINVKEWDIPNLYIFGTMHKNMGSICGCGFICHPIQNFLKPLITGGTGTKSIDYKQPKDFPNYLESGTKNSLALECACKAIDCTDVLLDFNNDAKDRRVKYCLKKLNRKIIQKYFYIDHWSNDYYISPYINLIPKFPGIGSIVTSELNEKYEIITRYGCHCVPFHKWKIDNKEYQESLRISLSHHNTDQEIDYFIDSLVECLINLNKKLKK